MVAEQRNDVITYMKAIAIMAMVLGHACVNTPVDSFVGYFHMPLFFFVSGYCFKPKYLCDAKTYLRRKVEGIYWPYLKWSLLFLALHNLLCSLHMYDPNSAWCGFYSLAEMKGRLLHIVTAMQMHDQLLGGYWFLKTLFWTSLLSYLWLRITHRIRYNEIVGICVFLLLTIADDAILLPVPYFNIESQEFAATTLFLTGYAFAKYQVREFPIWLCLLTMGLMIAEYFYWGTAMGLPFYSNYRIVPYLFTAVMIIWSIYTMCRKLLINSTLNACWGGICNLLGIIR